MEHFFACPEGSNRDATSAVAQKVIGLIVDILATASKRNPLASTEQVVAAVPEVVLPETGCGDEALLRELRGILEASMNPHSPGWMAHMDPPPMTIGWLGEAASAAVQPPNPNP